MRVDLIPILEDNYVFSLVNPATRRCVIVDPGEARPVVDYLKKNQLTLETILLTHHHADHVAGTTALKERVKSEIIGFKEDLHRLPAVTQSVQDQEKIKILGASFEVRHLPGHTSGHIVYHSKDLGICFCGDVLFNLGCGRIFEGSMGEMYESLGFFKELPDATQMYAAHEYTLTNCAFVDSVLKNENSDFSHSFKRYAEKMVHLREQGVPTIPFNLKEQKQFNPFLNSSAECFQVTPNGNTDSSSPFDVFQFLRTLRNDFVGNDFAQ